MNHTELSTKAVRSRYYSQHGEDWVADTVFRDVEDGYFVEVGCIDGRRYSNTLVLEERGWKGVCIEAHPDYLPLLKRNRRGSTVVHAAVGDQDRRRTKFYANARGSLSTLDKGKEEEFRKKHGKYFTGFKAMTVPMWRLDTLLSQLDVCEIHIMSIDVEGCEARVLRGLDFARFRPKLLIIEAESAWEERELDQVLSPFHYLKGFRLECNLFYFSSPDLLDRLRGISCQMTLCHTEHPLDRTGDQVKRVQIDIP